MCVDLLRILLSSFHCLLFTNAREAHCKPNWSPQTIHTNTNVSLIVTLNVTRMGKKKIQCVYIKWHDLPFRVILGRNWFYSQTLLLKTELWKQIPQRSSLNVSQHVWVEWCVRGCGGVSTSTASAPRLSRRLSVAAETSWTTLGSDLTSLCWRERGLLMYCRFAHCTFGLHAKRGQ